MEVFTVHVLAYVLTLIWRNVTGPFRIAARPVKHITSQVSDLACLPARVRRTRAETAILAVPRGTLDGK